MNNIYRKFCWSYAIIIFFFIVKYKIEYSYGKMLSYFDFDQFTDHLHEGAWCHFKFSSYFPRNVMEWRLKLKLTKSINEIQIAND
jgi:hypothetical protein